MRKIYVLDTSAFIHNPSVFKCFPESEVIIPIAVLNELDKLKKQANEAGRNARVSIKLIDELSEKADISTGILLENNALVKVDANFYDTNLPQFAGFGDPSYGDTQILVCAVAQKNNSHDITLVSNDINLRIKAKSRGMDAESHELDSYSPNELYSGVQVVTDEEIGLELQKQGFIDPRLFGLKLKPNECVVFQTEDNDILAMGRKVDVDKVKLIKKFYPWSLSSKNKEQSFAIDLIMDRSIDLISLIGRAGGGKSLLALACGLELVLNKKEYDKFIIYRPTQAVSKEIGYLPGTLEEKLAPWFQAIMDNLETLLSTKGHGDWKRNLEMFQKKGLIEMDAITFIRGRSIPNSIILVDEAQNLSRDDVKTLLTRAGEGTKIILTGDLEQIDNPDLDATDNGLTYVVEKFKDWEHSGHITLVQGERSRLATKASEIL